MERKDWFESLYDQCFDPLVRFLYALARAEGGAASRDAEGDIEDCVQEAFVLLWNRREDLKSHPNVKAWLYKTAGYMLRNKLSAARTRQRHTAFSLDDGLHDASAPNPTTEPEMLDRIREAAGDAEFKMLLAYYDKDRPATEVEKQYHLSPSGLRMKVKRACDRIRRALFTIFL